MLLTQPIKKSHRTKEEFVYDILREAIVRCRLEPGAKLVMDTLSIELEVSPIPIRGALQRLQAEGLVEITPHTGATVSEISPDTVNEIFVLLEALESAAVRAAATKVTKADLAHLRHLVDKMTTALQAGDADRWYDLNNQFHVFIARITELKLLFEFTNRALDSRDRLRHFYFESFISSRMSEAHEEHGQMIRLLENRDVEGLVALVAQHNRRAKEAYQTLIESRSNQ